MEDECGSGERGIHSVVSCINLLSTCSSYAGGGAEPSFSSRLLGGTSDHEELDPDSVRAFCGRVCGLGGGWEDVVWGDMGKDGEERMKPVVCREV
jgi:hypothetical protein